MGKYYGVVLQTGSKVFTDWNQAQAYIKTCPSGAQYKRFNSEAEAKSYIADILAGSQAGQTAGANPENIIADVSPTHAIAFVDGSFNPDTKTWGFGVVMFPASDKNQVVTNNGSGTVYAHARNITGEIYGAMRAVNMAIKAGYKKVTIYHDYQGISSWATGAWGANQEMTQKYRDWMTAKTKVIDIGFVKVDGHTGVEFNEMADVLAKKGCGIA